MSNNRISPSNKIVQRVSAGVMALGLVFSMVLFPVASFASTATYQTQSSPAAVTIPGGGSVTLTVRGFCLNYGKPFPTGQMSAAGLAADNVRSALNYSIGKGYTDSNARQVELGIWYLVDNTWHVTPHDLGTEVANNATAANLPVAGTDGTSLVDALTQNKVTITAQFVPQTADEFYGDGKVTVTNTGTTDLRVYMPIGVRFTAGSNGSFQDLIAYQLSAPAQATGTVSGTASPVSTGTVVTGTVTVEATGTVSGTASPAASETAVGTASPLATGTVVTGTATVESTSTVAATVAATTPTTMATTEATSTTAVETPTAMATVMAETPTATTVAGGNTLPQTGNGDSNGTAMAFLAMGLLMTVAGATALAVSKRKA